MSSNISRDTFIFFSNCKSEELWYTPVFSKMALHGGVHLELKKCTRGISGASSEFVWGDVHVSFLKKLAFCNFIPGSTPMLLHYLLFCRVYSSELPFVRSLAINIYTQSRLCI